MVIVLSSNICNPGRGIVDISIDLCRIDITLNQGVLSIVEKVHSQQRLSRVKDDDKAYNNISSDARVSASNHVYGSSLWQLGTFEYGCICGGRRSAQPFRQKIITINSAFANFSSFDH